MVQKTKLAAFFISLALLFSLLAGGCKKEEPNTQTAEQQKEMGTASSEKTFSAVITLETFPQDLKSGETLTLPVKVKNTSNYTWPMKTENPVNLAYHWRDKNGKKIVWDGIRTKLPKDLPPGEEILLDAKIEAPKGKGEHTIEFDLVQERIAWFGVKGSKTVKFTTTLK